MANIPPSRADDTIFSVQFDGSIPLTPDQISAIENAIQTAVAEQLASLSVSAAVQPIPKPEGLPDPFHTPRYPLGLYAIPTEPPEIFA